MCWRLRLSELSHAGPITTLVLGFGNPLWGDDGAGIEAVNMLAENEIPDGVRVEPAGLPGFGLAAWLGEASLSSLQRLVLVDAAHMGQAPGVWRRFTPEEVHLIARGGIVSLHEADLSSGLALSQALGLLPEDVLFYAVEPGSLEDGLGLSPEVQDALPEMVAEILLELLNGRGKHDEQENTNH
jgi:hydrogenase maturation protease